MKALILLPFPDSDTFFSCFPSFSQTTDSAFPSDPIAPFTSTRSSVQLCRHFIHLEPTYPFLAWAICSIVSDDFLSVPSYLCEFLTIRNKVHVIIGAINDVWAEHGWVSGCYSRQSCSLAWNHPGFLFQTSRLGKPSTSAGSVQAPGRPPLILTQRFLLLLFSGCLPSLVAQCILIYDPGESFYPQFIISAKVSWLKCISAPFLL